MTLSRFSESPSSSERLSPVGNSVSPSLSFVSLKYAHWVFRPIYRSRGVGIQVRRSHWHQLTPSLVNNLKTRTVHVNPRPVGRAYLVNVDRGPLGHLSAIFDRYDVRMHSSVCWNDAPTRRASGRDLRPATPTAGSRARPRAVFRTLGVLS